MTPLPRSTRPTMNDVAKLADVSLKTVSRVVNGTESVSAAKAVRVEAAIRELGFRRNEQARQLRQGTTATIGLIIEDLADPFYSTLARAVEEVAHAHHHALLVSSSAEDPRRAEELVRSLSGRGIDGLIITPAEGMDPRVLAAEGEAGCSLVFVDRPSVDVDADTVLVDNRGGTAAGVRHLLAGGHRRIAFVGDTASLYTAQERRIGYLEALETAGIERDDNLVLMANPAAPESGEAFLALLDQADPPTAILAGNNRWSVRVVRLLRQRGISIALVGFDDFELADALEPPVSVVAQDPAAVGRLAAELLFSRLAGDTGPRQHIQLGATLIPRGSGERAPR
ncbi:LacI family transcriptional regulator [Mycetocola sp. BIGb0189]|uniref:LacI family DNA-binding transcriptional regulator n=1 Tax=Mycetocola sp. BIGb0189 TaxID=2940604 RepID=UPI002169586C|nr:LacI family DNA-binding transcriptional regulator [Mycetocola sp. BIGb0189]MCS4276529.1 LacI family transcriptional regulator [Mycetocola sp. BIGb0189]